MGHHDRYGKGLLRDLLGDRYHDGAACCAGRCCWVDYETGGGGQIDGTIDSLVAVEIESRKITQILGALLKLLLHPYPKKLVVLLPAHIDNPALAKQQCEKILGRFLQADDFRVVLASGTGHKPQTEDAEIIRNALREWDVVPL